MKFIIIGSALFIVAAITLSSFFITGTLIGDSLGFHENLYYNFNEPLLIISVISFLVGFILVFIGVYEKSIFKSKDKK